MPELPADMARELEGMLKAGGGDPFAMLAGAWSFHSAFLAPFSPSFANARQQFLVDGGGPLSATVEQLRHQGLGPAEAVEAARRLIGAAQGLCVAVIAGDNGVITVPQPFYGDLAEGWRAGAVQVLAEPYREPFAAALAGLEATAARGWPRAVAGPALQRDDLRTYWIELAHGCASALEFAGTRGDARLADLGHWVADAVTRLAPADLDAEDHAALARCRLAAGDTAGACACIAACAAAGGEDAVVELFDAVATVGSAQGGNAAAVAWLAGEGAAIADRLGCPYDAALARVRLVAAAGGGHDELAPAVEALLVANRKLARQALTREPIWQVTAPDPGELIDTAAAAELIGRSPAALGKRLDARTIPFHARDGQVRLPRRALEAWKAVLDSQKLLD
jgi:hypothetical protein